MPETPSFSFPKTERLKSKKLIEAVFADGQKTKAWPLISKHLDVPLSADVPCQVVVSVSKRSFKRAVDRNRIKRLMKEAWRLQKHRLYDALNAHEKQRGLVLIYVGKELPNLEEMQACVERLIGKMNQSLASENTKNPSAPDEES